MARENPHVPERSGSFRKIMIVLQIDCPPLPSPRNPKERSKEETNGRDRTRRNALFLVPLLLKLKVNQTQANSMLTSLDMKKRKATQSDASVRCRFVSFLSFCVFSVSPTTPNHPHPHAVATVFTRPEVARPEARSRKVNEID